MFLLNPKKNKSAAHVWNGKDTVCKMYQTGGMRKSRYHLSATTMNKPICCMCLNVHAKSKNPVLFVDKEYLNDVDTFTIRIHNL